MSDTTPTPETTGVEALLQKVRRAHATFRDSGVFRAGPAERWFCSCGEMIDEEPSGRDISRRHEAHVAAEQAAALVPWLAQQRADALREAAREFIADCADDCAGRAVDCAAVEDFLTARADRVAPTIEADSEKSCRRCGLNRRAAIAGVLCDPPHAGDHDFPTTEADQR